MDVLFFFNAAAVVVVGVDAVVSLVLSSQFFSLKIMLSPNCAHRYPVPWNGTAIALMTNHSHPTSEIWGVFRFPDDDMYYLGKKKAMRRRGRERGEGLRKKRID